MTTLAVTLPRQRQKDWQHQFQKTNKNYSWVCQNKEKINQGRDLNKLLRDFVKKVGGFWFLAKNWQKTAQVFTTKVYVIRMNNVHWTSWNSSFYKRQYFLLEKGGKCWYFLMTRQYFEKYKREDTLDMQIWKLLNDAATAARTAAV